MNAEYLSSLINIISFGALIQLSILMFLNPLKVNKIANIFLAIFFLLWASFSVDEILFLVTGKELNTLGQYLFRAFQYFAPISFYFSVKFFTNPKILIKTKILLHIILPLIFLILEYLYYFIMPKEQILNYFLLIIMLGQTLTYSLISYIIIRKHKKAILLYSSQTREINLFWLERMIIVVILMAILVVVYNIFFSFEELNVYMNFVLLVVVFNIAFHSMRQKEIFPFNTENQREIVSLYNEPEQEDLKKKVVSDNELISLKNELNQFMQNKKPYLDPELNLVKLSELFGTSPHRLSYVINTGFNKNFFNFINHYRVETAKILLKNEKMDNFTIIAIAYEAGFNSKTSFNNTFKKITGFTPTEFKNSSSSL